MDENKDIALQELEAKEGCRVMKVLHHGDKIAYIFSQDFTDGKRSYGYVIPRENGASWAYLPVKDMFMQSETDIETMLHKEIVKMFRTEAKEATQAVEDKVQDQKETLKKNRE